MVVNRRSKGAVTKNASKPKTAVKRANQVNKLLTNEGIQTQKRNKPPQNNVRKELNIKCSNVISKDMNVEGEELYFIDDSVKFIIKKGRSKNSASKKTDENENKKIKPREAVSKAPNETSIIANSVGAVQNVSAGIFTHIIATPHKSADFLHVALFLIIVLTALSGKKPHYYDPTWLGNEDDTGSVCSGILEEDYCLQCGESTLSSDVWNGVILCDYCDGEYHMQCAGLEQIPDDAFTCRSCIEQDEREKCCSFNMPGTIFEVGHIY
jgi:hypothetical protein